MDTTVFLAQLWGPILLVIGLGIFTSRSFYAKIYHDLQKEPLAVLIFAMVGMATGIVQVLSHNTWETLPQILISLLGWGLVLKAATFAVAPKFVDRSGDIAVQSKMLPAVGVVLLIAGAYLTHFAYLS